MQSQERRTPRSPGIIWCYWYGTQEDAACKEAESNCRKAGKFDFNWRYSFKLTRTSSIKGPRSHRTGKTHRSLGQPLHHPRTANCAGSSYKKRYFRCRPKSRFYRCRTDDCHYPTRLHLLLPIYTDLLACRNSVKPISALATSIPQKHSPPSSTSASFPL